MTLGLGDTICALATGTARAAIAVLRLSGPDCGRIASSLGAGPPPPRLASLRRLRDPRSGETLDEAIVLWFEAGRSFTGEDSLELHVHGGPAVVAAVLDAVQSLGARQAEPGEFTRRAVLSGRLDLTQAEGIADLVAAETDLQRRQALRQSQGVLGSLYSRWTVEAVRLLAEAEAEIEFEDQDLPVDLVPGLLSGIARLQGELSRHLADGGRGERLRDGVSIALVGAPNAGKSSLLNRLAGRDVAIVSDLPGTTRDVIEARLVLAGVPVTLADTAGLRAPLDSIEAEGIRRARATAEQADLVLELRDLAASRTAADLSAEPTRNGHDAAGSRRLTVWTKADLVAGPLPELAISARTGLGLDALLHRLEREVGVIAGMGEEPGVTRHRHRHALEQAHEALSRGGSALLPELRAEELRVALRWIGRITGRIEVESVLDEVFRGFCIGK